MRLVLLAAAILLSGCLGLPLGEPQHAVGRYYVSGALVTIELRTASDILMSSHALPLNATVTNHGPGAVHVDTGGCGLRFDVEVREGPPRGRGLGCTADFVDHALEPGDSVHASWSWDGRTYGPDQRETRFVPGSYVVYAAMSAFDPSGPEWEFVGLRAEVPVRLV